MSSVVRSLNFAFALLLASMLAPPKILFSAASHSRRTKAAATFERAVRMRTTLESMPESKRQRVDYQKAIRTFQAVYHLDPAYGKSPVALSAAADLCEEMGRLFSRDRDFLEAVKEYGFVISEYPHSGMARDALFTLGEIYRTDLDDPEKAREAFQQYVEKYPRSEKASQAQQKLQEIEGAQAERSLPAKPKAKELRSTKIPEVSDIRRWVGTDYSRVVIAVGEEVKFDTARLSNPERIVLDLEGTRLSPALVGKTFPVEDGFLRQIRVAQFSSTVTRVVLDVQGIEEYSVIPLPNPFRLVIDVHGKTAAATAAKSGRSLPTPAASAMVESSPDEALSKPPAPSDVASATAGSPADSGAAKTSPKSPELAKPVGSLGPPKPPVGDKTTATESASLEPTAKAAKRPAEVNAKAAAPTASGSRTLTRALGLKIGSIVIDAGHGGHDTGTIGPTGLREKDVVLDVALRLKKLLERNVGCDVVMTRSDDTFIPLEERTAIANEKAADLFISVHANASRDRSARGIETYYLNFTSSPDALEVAARENATSQESVHELQDLIKKIAMTEKIEESQEFAREIQREVHKRVAKAGGGQRDRGVKKAPFVVLIGAKMPSVLAEISFLTNPRDERMLKRGDYRQKIAEALYTGVVDYVNNLGGVKVAQRASESSSASHPDF